MNEPTKKAFTQLGKKSWNISNEYMENKNL